MLILVKCKIFIYIEMEWDSLRYLNFVFVDVILVCYRLVIDKNGYL